MCTKYVVLPRRESEPAFPDPVSVVGLCWVTRSESHALEPFLFLCHSSLIVRLGRAPATFTQTDKRAFTESRVTKENKTGDKWHFTCWLASDWV